MPKVKRALKWFAAGLGGLLLVTAGGGAAGYFWLQGPQGKAWLARQIEDAVSVPGEIELSIGRLEGSLPHSIQAGDIAVADAAGIWLSAAELSINWNPWQLLSGTLELESIQLTAVDLSRLPTAAGGSEGESSGGLPRLPINVALHLITADEIVLGAPVLGQAARFTLAGKADGQEDGSFAAGIDLRRLDGPEARFGADLIHDAAGGQMTAAIDAREAPGGLVALLLDLPDLPATEMKLNGSGPLESWQGKFSLSLGELAQVESDLVLAREEDGLRLTLDGSNESRPTGSAPLARLAAGRTDFSLDAVWQEGARLDVRRLTVANDRLTLDLQGDLQPETGDVDLQLALRSTEDPLLAELAGLDALGPVTADLAVTGTLNRPVVDLDVEGGPVISPDLEVAGATARGRVSASGDLLGPEAGLSLSLTGDLRAPRLPGQDDINTLIGDNLPWTLEGELDPIAGRLDISRLEVTVAAARLTATGPLDLITGDGTLAAEATVPDFAALQPVTSLRLGGQVELSGPVTLAGFGSRIDADLKGRWTQPSSDIALIGLAAGNAVDLATQLSFANGTLRLTNTSARSQRSQVNLALSVTPESELRDASYQVILPDAAFLSGELGAELSGAARAEGTAAGPFDSLAVEGSLNLARMQVGDQLFEEITGRYRLRLQGGDIDGPVNLALHSPFGAAEAKADLSLRSDALSLKNLEASLPETSVIGELRLPLDGAAPLARLQARVAELTPWLQFAGLDGSGSGTLTVQMNGPGQSDPVLLDADLSEVSLVTEPGAAPVTAESLSLKLKADDLALETPARFTLHGRNLARDQMNLTRLDLEGEGTPEDLTLSLSAQGNWIDPFELRARGDLQSSGEQLSVVLREAEGKAFGQPLKLRQEAHLTTGPDGSRLDSLDVVSGETEFTATAELGEERIDVAARLDRLPMRTVNAFWDSGITGMVSADLTVSGSLTAPVGEARLAATGLRPKDAKDLPELELKAVADWRDGRATLSGNLGGPQVTAADFSLEGPLVLLNDGGGLEVPDDGALAGRVDWAGKLATLTVFFPLPQHRIAGDGVVRLALSGTAAQPVFDGDISLSNGRYESLEYGTLLKDLSLAATLNKDKLSLSRLEAQDGAKGKITGEGELAIDPERDFPFDFGLQLTTFRAVHRDDATAQLGGTIDLKGSLAAPKLLARLTTETVEINLATELPPNVTTLDVIEVRNGVVQEKPSTEQEAAPVDVALDVVVDMPQRVFVRGRGLDSEWSGRIQVKGSSADPKISGNVNLVRGQLSLVGKVFRLDQGRVELPASANSEPSLDVTAIHKGRELEVTARMRGPISKPELELTSMPEVPRDEIISRVLFNKSASELTPGEAAQLALAVRDLTGQGGGADVLGFARRTMGVDVLRVNTDAEGKAAVEAGRYLTDEVYLGVKQGADPESSSAGVEVELTPNVTIESEVTRSGANKSGVRFQLDY